MQMNKQLLHDINKAFKALDALNDIRNDIESELNDAFRQPSIDSYWRIKIKCCQRHIEIIDKYMEGLEDDNQD